jgi:hypothetical protein
MADAIFEFHHVRERIASRADALVFVFLFGFSLSFPLGYGLGFCSANFCKERLGCGWGLHFA